MRIRSALVLVAAAAITGCGDGGGGPNEPAPPADIEGSWSFEAHDMAAAGYAVKCGLRGTLEFVQDGGDVTGTYVMNLLYCSGPGMADTTEGPYVGSIVSGTVENNKVHFHFDNEEADQHGTVSGNRMSGVCTWEIPVDDSYLVMTGKWSAVRLGSAQLGVQGALTADTRMAEVGKVLGRLAPIREMRFNLRGRH